MRNPRGAELNVSARDNPRTGQANTVSRRAVPSAEWTSYAVAASRSATSRHTGPFPSDSAEWLDTDNDSIGNNADTDDDNDGLLDEADGYPLVAIGTLTDTDGDGRPDDCDNACTSLGMAADPDDDNDGVLDDNNTAPLDLGISEPCFWDDSKWEECEWQ